MVALSLFDLIFLGALVLIAITLLFFSRSVSDLAPTNPKAYLAAHPRGRGDRGGRQLAVCAGDSLTRGSASVDYVAMLASRMPDWDFVNAGINAELAFNLARRMDDIVALDPDAVSILIGTNDINATFGFRSALGYIATERLPESPSPYFFRENLVGIVRTLKRETRARVALFSMPPIGEESGHYAYLRTEDYARIVRTVAEEEGVGYLPLRERLCAFLESLPPQAKPPLDFRGFGAAQVRAWRMQRFLGKSLDEISASNRFHILVDGLHLNTHGASMAADLAERFLKSLP
jgi:lysophospholipase L1-like esterase